MRYVLTAFMLMCAPAQAQQWRTQTEKLPFSGDEFASAFKSNGRGDAIAIMCQGRTMSIGYASYLPVSEEHKKLENQPADLGLAIGPRTWILPGRIKISQQGRLGVRATFPSEQVRTEILGSILAGDTVGLSLRVSSTILSAGTIDLGDPAEAVGLPMANCLGYRPTPRLKNSRPI